jgi:hypothetical protein
MEALTLWYDPVLVYINILAGISEANDSYKCCTDIALKEIYIFFSNGVSTAYSASILAFLLYTYNIQIFHPDYNPVHLCADPDSQFRNPQYISRSSFYEKVLKLCLNAAVNDAHTSKLKIF